jgi:hypothetical protein
MIVRDLGDAWQAVLQTDHADLSAGLAEAWRERGPRHDSLLLATRRHDDGWAVWEQEPRVDGDGKPVGFLEVHVPAHLAFYRACIAAVADQDPYAGLLVSMHGAGIYRQRYGHDLGLSLTRVADARELVDTFVDEQEAAYEARMRESGTDDDERWADYERLQAYDRLSLYFCMRPGESAEIQGYRIEPVSEWHIRMDPFPLEGDRAELSLVRRVVPKGARSEREFRDEFARTEPERLEIVVEPA